MSPQTMATGLKPPPSRAADSEETEALFREARELERRRRRRRLGAASAVAVLIAAALIGGSTGGGGHRRTGESGNSPAGGAAGPRTSRVIGGGFATGFLALEFAQITGEQLWAANGLVVERSDDGGMHWRSIVPVNLAGDDPGGRIAGFTSLGSNDLWLAASEVENAAPDHQRGFAVEYSTDGGRTWRWTGIGSCIPNCAPMSLSFINPNHGWGLAANGDIYSTTDGGQNWSLLTRVSTSPAALSAAIDFATRSAGWLTTGPRLYSSDDGGRRWQPTSLPRADAANAGPFLLGAPRFFGPRDGVIPAVLDDGATALYETADSGRDWAVRPVPVLRQTGSRGRWLLPHVNFSTRTVWSLQLWNGPLAPLLITANAGATWSRVPEPPTYAEAQPVWEFAMATPTAGWLIAAAAPCTTHGAGIGNCVNPIMLRTSDAGRTWRVIQQPPQPAGTRDSAR